MDQKRKITFFKPDTKVVNVTADGICFCTDQVSGSDCGVILYHQKQEALRIPFSEQGRRGNLYGMKVHLPDPENYRYQYYAGEKMITDRYAKIIKGTHLWGERERDSVSGGFYTSDFDWEEDRPPEIAFQDSILYGLHVRGFTKHKSSGVKQKGTFEGIVEKIPYLKDLGITAIELLPAYEFEERESSFCPGEGEAGIVNCWGFKQGYYYAPKAAYSASERPDHSFKKMVLELHRAGMEVWMYFYFPADFNRSDILDILRYWVIEYHIDGIHLLGEGLPLTVITQDSLLSGMKLLYNEYSYWEENPRYHNTGVFRDHFQIQMRRFLKGDEDMISSVLYHQRCNPPDRGTINYMADYNGFSLFDLTAYDKKHNEVNGETNHDGTDYNYSWNCGVEGPSRKKEIQTLRSRQMKNALCFLFLAQGTPFLFSGDEFGNTRYGNNNTYCQDNEVGWVKWNHGTFGKEILEFARFLIAFRKAHPILHMPEEMQILDSAKCGYPDVSYHGESAWRPDMNPYSRTVGIMYCGKYAKGPDGGEDDFLYIAINMYWMPRKLGLPKLPKDWNWHLVQNTSFSGTDGCPYDAPSAQQTERAWAFVIKERSISIFKSVRS